MELCRQLNTEPLVVLAARQKQLRLDAKQAGCHLEVIRRLIEAERSNAQQELLGDARDGNVVDVDLLVANQSQQQIQRTRVLGELDDEDLGRCRVSNGRRARMRQRHIVHGLGRI